jgi:hypothetical protein
VKDLAPIVLFVYNRPRHTEQTLLALQKNLYASESILYVYADGPPENCPAENMSKIKETRELVKGLQWCKEVHVIEREANLRLDDNVIDGITSVIKKHGKVIVLEDDLITSRYFLKYCNNGLELYKDAPNVYAINGYQFPIKTDKVDTFLCPLATSSWGWATWAEKWNIFENMPKQKAFLEDNPVLKQRFNFGGYDYIKTLKKLDIANSTDKPWDIRWYYSVFIRNGLGLFPTRSLVSNIGFDGSGKHGQNNEQNIPLVETEYTLTKQDQINLEYYSLMLNPGTDILPVKQDTSPVKEFIKNITPPVLLNLLLTLKRNTSKPAEQSSKNKIAEKHI